MSGYKGHLAGGLVTYGLLFLLVSQHYTPTPLLAFEWLLAALFGSLFPDIDIKSKGQNIFYWLCAFTLLLLCLYQMYTTCALLALCTIAPQLSRHRGITHRAWFLLLLCVGVAWLLSTSFPALQQPILLNLLFFFVGSLSHLYLDFGLKQMLRW